MPKPRTCARGQLLVVSNFLPIALGRAGYLTPPSSEPDMRVSRIRLSQLVVLPQDYGQRAAWASTRLKSPCFRKVLFGPR